MLAERISRLIYPTLKFSEFGRLYLEDPEFLDYYNSYVGPENYHSLDRKFALDQLIQLTTQVEGDTAECGVYEGASSFLICRRIRGSSKQHYAFDSFEGLSEPGVEDGCYWRQGNLAAAEQRVRDNLRSFDFVVYKRGWIPARFAEVQDRRFSFVHIDVDLYQPTLSSLEFFYDRLTTGGVMLCDDYGFSTCPGAKLAMDSFFSERPESIVHLPTGQGFIIKLPGETKRPDSTKHQAMP
jgi:hypothetical protein